jgi:hypothetical protein
VPLHICVRARSVSATASWQRRAMPTGSHVSSVNPLRIFIVADADGPFTARMVDSTKWRSRRQPMPPLRLTTFLTGQPKLMSGKAGSYTSSSSRAASAIASGSAPKIWMPMGRSSSLKRR